MNYKKALYYIKRLVRNVDPGKERQALEKAEQALEDCIEMGLTGEGGFAPFPSDTLYPPLPIRKAKRGDIPRTKSSPL